jgi:hypothetical protein
VQTSLTTTVTTVTNAQKKTATTTTTRSTRIEKLLLSRLGSGERVPALLVSGTNAPETLVIWVHPEGKRSLFRNDALVPEAQKIVDAEAAILAPDVFLTGEFAGAPAPAVNETYAGFTFGYNRPLLANRVHDILTAVEFGRQKGFRKIHLAGFEKAGPWVVLARGLCGDHVSRTAADLDQFRFEKVQKTSDEMMLPGALKYGGLPAFAALAAPHPILLHNARGTGVEGWMQTAYKSAGGGPEQVQDAKASAAQVIDWVLR